MPFWSPTPFTFAAQVNGAELLLKVDSKTQQYLDTYQPEKRAWLQFQIAAAASAEAGGEVVQTEEAVDEQTKAALAEMLSEKAPEVADEPMDDSSKNASLTQQVQSLSGVHKPSEFEIHTQLFSRSESFSFPSDLQIHESRQESYDTLMVQ